LIEFLGLPEGEDVFPTLLGRVTVVLEVMLVVSAKVILGIQVAGIPISTHRHRLRPPVRPDTELGIAEPVRAFILGERVLGGLERAGDFREIFGLGKGDAAECDDEWG
jgi:hypothetical protein